MSRRKHAVVTGGAGFIGSHLVDELIERNFSVIIYDSLEQGRQTNVHPAADFYYGSIEDVAAIRAVMKGADYVFHLAALASVPACSNDPVKAFSVNTQGTVNVLDAVRETCPRAAVLFTSSASVYGSAMTTTLFTENDVLAPASVYATTKMVAENVCAIYKKAYELDTRVVRFANVYGPRQPRYVLFDLCRKLAAADDEIAILGSGRERRDFIYVSDAVSAVIKVATRESLGWDVFNVGTGSATSILELAKIVARQARKDKVKFKPTNYSWLGDIDSLVCDTTRLRSLGHAMPVPLNEGVQKYLDWHAGQFTTAISEG